jgi:hypothetical protein
MSYLGLNQVNNCRCVLNTWRKTAASVGLDLDSLVLSGCILVTYLVRTPFKIVVNISVPETAARPVVLGGGGQTQTGHALPLSWIRPLNVGGHIVYYVVFDIVYTNHM